MLLSGSAALLMLHPILDEARAQYDAEIVIFAVDEVEQRCAIQLFQVRQI
jgi:hypothetical protein